jgi:general secretion pathway protein H
MGAASARTERGFTLVELVVAISVAALLLATAPAALDRLYDAMVYRSTVRHMIVEMKAARLRAMQDGQPVAFVVDLEARRFGVDGRTEIGIPDALKVSAIVADVEVSEGGRSAIRFYPDGSATGGSVELERSSGRGVRLRVDWLLGRVSQEPLGG